MSGGGGVLSGGVGVLSGGGGVLSGGGGVLSGGGGVVNVGGGLVGGWCWCVLFFAAFHSSRVQGKIQAILATCHL